MSQPIPAGSLDGRTALVTGSSRGIGADTARYLAEGGANVVINFRNKAPRAEKLAAELRELGVEILNTDITGQCHQDRRLITGDSPLASNNIGKLAAEALLQEARA